LLSFFCQALPRFPSRALTPRVMAAVAVPLLVFAFCGAVSAADPPTVTLRNGVKMPMIAAGSWQYNSSQAYESIKAALSSGFTMVDTAYDYNNQDGVGRAIATVPRERVFLETKVPGCLLDPSMKNPFQCYESTKKDLEASLRLLSVSYIDLVILHFPPGPSMLFRSCSNLTGTCQMARAQWRAMEEFYRAGKVRAIGVSNYCPSCFECLRDTEVFPMVNQVMYHIGMGIDPGHFMTYAKSHGVVIQAYSVLGNAPWTGHAAEEITQGNLTSDIGRAHNKSAVQVALKWVVEQGVPAVTKSSNPKHLASDLDLWSWSFTVDELMALNQHKSPWGYPSFACNFAEDSASLLI